MRVRGVSRCVLAPALALALGRGAAGRRGERGEGAGRGERGRRGSLGMRHHGEREDARRSRRGFALALQLSPEFLNLSLLLAFRAANFLRRLRRRLRVGALHLENLSFLLLELRLDLAVFLLALRLELSLVGGEFRLE